MTTWMRGWSGFSGAAAEEDLTASFDTTKKSSKFENNIWVSYMNIMFKRRKVTI